MTPIGGQNRLGEIRSLYLGINTPLSNTVLTKQKTNAPLPSASKVKPQRKPLKISIKRTLWQRAQGCCEHVDRQTGQRCTSKFALEIDHMSHHLHSVAGMISSTRNCCAEPITLAGLSKPLGRSPGSLVTAPRSSQWHLPTARHCWH